MAAPLPLRLVVGVLNAILLAMLLLGAGYQLLMRAGTTEVVSPLLIAIVCGITAWCVFAPSSGARKSGLVANLVLLAYCVVLLVFGRFVADIPSVVVMAVGLGAIPLLNLVLLFWPTISKS